MKSKLEDNIFCFQSYTNFFICPLIKLIRDKERLNRYKDKIDLSLDRLSKIEKAYKKLFDGRGRTKAPKRTIKRFTDRFCPLEYLQNVTRYETF